MVHTFAELIEDVKKLSQDEQLELHSLLDKWLIASKRRTIRYHYEDTLREENEGKIMRVHDSSDLQRKLEE